MRVDAVIDLSGNLVSDPVAKYRGDKTSLRLWYADVPDTIIDALSDGNRVELLEFIIKRDQIIVANVVRFVNNDMFDGCGDYS